MSEMPAVRAFSHEWLQWLWYVHKRNRIARYVCDIGVTAWGRDDVAMQVMELATKQNFRDAWARNTEIIIGEDAYTDTPRITTTRKLNRFVNDWWFDYYADTMQCDRSGNFISIEPKSISTHMRFEIMKRDTFRCCLCGATLERTRALEIDHIVPQSRGGSNSPWNLWVLCWECNNGKSDKMLHELPFSGHGAYHSPYTPKTPEPTPAPIWEDEDLF